MTLDEFDDSATKITRVLLVLQNEQQELFYRWLLASEKSIKIEFDIAGVVNIGAALEKLQEQVFDICILHLSANNPLAIDDINTIKDCNPNIPIVILTYVEDLYIGITAVQQGAQDYLAEGRYSSSTLIKTIFYAVERQRLFGVINFLKAQHEQATKDNVTSLPSRQVFFEYLKKAINEAKRYNRKIAVVYLDLDGFKEINDALGHDAGDELLREVAKRIKSIIRETDLLARIGGDEFALILYEIKKQEIIAGIANFIASSIAKPFELRLEQRFVTASIGISTYPEDAETAVQLVKCADLAMYHAKKLGKNNFQYYDESLTAKAKERLQIVEGLKQAFVHNEFEVFLQPKVNYERGSIIGAESLIRWNHKERGIIMPGSFIPIAEECGLITLLGNWMFNRVCEQLYASKIMLANDIKPAINISVKQLSSHTFISGLEKLLEDNGISPQQIDVEITEGSFLDINGQGICGLKELKNLGFDIYLDDFGTGYSCLQYLSKLPIDYLKIDKSFIDTMLTDSKNMTIVRSIISLAKCMNVGVVAEGVETVAQAERLASEGCVILQGYLFAKPMDWYSFENYLGKNNLEIRI